MTPRGCLPAVTATLSLVLVLCPQGASGASLLLCQPHTRCGEQFYDPLRHCCHDGALVALSESRQCGNCSYRVCFEQCCPRWPLDVQEPLVVKLAVDDCFSPPARGDKLCRSVS